MAEFAIRGIDAIDRSQINFISGFGNDGQGLTILRGGTQPFEDDAILVFETVNETVDGELDGGSGFIGLRVFANQADFDAGIEQFTYTPQNPGQIANIQNSGDSLGDTYVRFNANVLQSDNPGAPRLETLALFPGANAGDNIGRLILNRNTDVDFDEDGQIDPGPVEEGNNLFFATPICYTPGTLIATIRGQKKVEQIKPGDMVLTRDNGTQEVRWVGRRHMNAAELRSMPKFCPILIRAGALGNNEPERDMMVSPNHRMLLTTDLASLMFGEREVLVAAKHLTGLPGVDVHVTKAVSYIHLLFDNHEIILADGVWSESFQPGAEGMASVGKEQRQEIITLFPELRGAQGIKNFPAARRLLRAYEAHLLTLESEDAGPRNTERRRS